MEQDNAVGTSSQASDPGGSQESKESTSSTEAADLYQYEAQLYGFTPTSLINGMFNSVCDFYRDGLKAFTKACSEKSPTLMTEAELTDARHSVGEKIDRDICTVFDALEHFLLANVFSIPDNVVLPEDRCQLRRLDNQAEDSLSRKRNELCKKIIAVKYANAKLSQHLTEASKMQASLDEIINKLSTSDSHATRRNAEGIADWISYYSETIRKALEENKS